VQLWQPQTGKNGPASLSFFDSIDGGLAFNPSGKLVAVGIRQRGGNQPRTYTELGAEGYEPNDWGDGGLNRTLPYAVRSVTISPDGKAAAGIADHTVVVFNLNYPDMPKDLIRAACMIAGRGLNPREWADHLGGFQTFFPYRETCPPD